MRLGFTQPAADKGAPAEGKVGVLLGCGSGARRDGQLESEARPRPAAPAEPQQPRRGEPGGEVRRAARSACPPDGAESTPAILRRTPRQGSPRHLRGSPAAFEGEGDVACPGSACRLAGYEPDRAFRPLLAQVSGETGQACGRGIGGRSAVRGWLGAATGCACCCCCCSVRCWESPFLQVRGGVRPATDGCQSRRLGWHQLRTAKPS